ncbi:MAG: ABC transporter ATP-binding protein [Ignavibacteriae bacterium]|nr:ABC transporter ATP-binding protein [Ignavibacteriota bacterium]
MNGLRFEVAGLSKTYNRRSIFSQVSFTLNEGDSIIIGGRNGSGKSTLLKILIGVLSQTKGTISVSVDGKEVKKQDLFRSIGFVSPYLQMYDEFTALENLDLYRKIRTINVADEMLSSLLERVNLTQAKNQLVRTFSSGMKQRLKYAFALLHQPPFLLLDEPTANLDSEGKAIVHEIVQEQKKRGLIIIATNEPDEIKWGDSVLNLDEFKTKAGNSK